MPAKSTYSHYKLTQAKRQTLNVNAFGGVDFSSQRLQVATHRAIDLLNFVYKDGVIQKRQGYTEVAVVPTKNYIAYPYDNGTITTTILTNTSKRFNGIWRFLAEDGEYHIIAHIGKVLFEIKDLDQPIVKFELLSSTGVSVGSDSNYYPTTYEHLDQKSMAFVGNNRLWFLGGNKFMVIGFRAGDSQLIYEPVEESQYTFIPTTTTSITYKNSIVQGRSAFDYANNMTIWRQNTCLSGTGKSADDYRRTKYYEYTLDAPLKLKHTAEDVEALKLNKNLASISTATQKELAKIHIRVEEIVIVEEE